jgi:hypothetical protein
VAAHQATTLKAGDDAAHRGRANLFGVGEFAEGARASEDEDGERGELSGADTTFAVANAKAPEQMDGGGVELVREFGGGRDRAARDAGGRGGV